MKRKNILLTGATGVMGFEGLKQLIENELFHITLLVRPGKKSRKKLKRYLNHERVRIVWGDLCCYDDVLKAVEGVEMILHLGGMVSPKADLYPALTMKVNITASVNIVRAVKEQPDPDRIQVVYIGSVAQLGHKEPPDHFGKSGDRMTPARQDHYAVSKILAEKVIAESGLHYWVSLRQTAILYPDLIKKGLTPTTFHVPLKGVLEWATVEDSGRLLVKICETELPENFWRNFYNISSGKEFRMSNYDFEQKLLKAIYCPPVEKIFEPNWFATKNFHGCWYSDADLLEEHLAFRGKISCEEYFNGVIRKQVPGFFRLAKIVPPGLIKLILRKLAHHKTSGTLHWIKSNNREKINIHFGSYEAWEKIPSWKTFTPPTPSQECEEKRKAQLISKPSHTWNLDDMRKVAEKYDGKCLSESMSEGDIDTFLLWENEAGDQFQASPRYVVLGGYFPDRNLWSEMLPHQIPSL